MHRTQGQRRAKWQQLLARLRIGDALVGHGVAAQVGKRAVVIQTRGLLQFLKHGDKALWLKTRARHDPIADAVGLTLHVARKVQLTLHGCGRATHHDGVGSTHAAGRGCSAGSEHAQDHGGHHHRTLPSLLGHHAGNVALGHVAEFVRQHRGQFIGAGHRRNQTQMDAQVPAR